MFYQVQLWPWRVRRFLELANESLCTFTNHVRRIEIDHLRVRGKEADVGKVGSEVVDSHYGGMMIETMLLPHPPCFRGVQSIRVCNVDWTLFSVNEQTIVRNNFSQFARLDQLELQGVVFHDLREVFRIINDLETLQHLTVNISFTKYLQYAISLAQTLRLPSNLHSLEVETEDGIAAMLSCIMASHDTQKIRILKLRNIKPVHLSYVKMLLKKSGRSLQHLVLGIVNNEVSRMNEGAS